MKVENLVRANLPVNQHARSSGATGVQMILQKWSDLSPASTATPAGVATARVTAAATGVAAIIGVTTAAAGVTAAITGVTAAALTAIFIPFDRTSDTVLLVIGRVSKGASQSLFAPGLGSSFLLGDFCGQFRVRLCEPREPVVDITRVCRAGDRDPTTAPAACDEDHIIAFIGIGIAVEFLLVTIHIEEPDFALALAGHHAALVRA